MRTIGIILLTLFAVGLQAADLSAPFLTDKWSIKSDLMADHPVPVGFISTVSRDELAKTPAWQQESEHPPLSPRKAEAIALAMLRKIAGERHWTQPDISLRAFDVRQGAAAHREIRWLYVLHFGFLGTMDFESCSLNIIVLMDGTAIEPRKLEYKTIERYDYPGLGNTNVSAFYAFPWDKQLHLYEEQGWSIDSVGFTKGGETNKMRAAIIRLQRAQTFSQEKRSPTTALEPKPTAP